MPLWLRRFWRRWRRPATQTMSERWLAQLHSATGETFERGVE